jgi:hypothetical protein
MRPATPGAWAPAASGWQGSPGFGLERLALLVICVVSKGIRLSAPSPRGLLWPWCPSLARCAPAVGDGF